MADFASALPIRTELVGQVAYQDAIIKLGDATNPATQQAKVDTFGSQYQVAIDAAGNLIGDQNLSSSWWRQSVSPSNGPAAPGAVAAFSNLIGGEFSSTLPTLANGQQAAVQVDSSGRLWSNVTNLPAAVDTNWGTVGASTIRVASEIGNAAGAADFNFGAASAQTVRVAALVGNAAGIADFNNGATGAQTLRVAANLAVAGANVSGTNPVPVTLTSAPVGTPVNNYNTAASVAAGATSNHVYAITAAKTFQGKKVWASASGALKVEVQVSPDGSTYSTLWVGFNSTANPNITIDLDELVFLESGTGSTVRVIRTNEEKQAQDVYSTISGTEV